MNTSKKLSMWKPPVTVVIFVCPVDVRVGLSLSLTVAGRLPPLISSCSISVSNVRVAPVRLLNVTFIDPVTGAWKCVAPLGGIVISPVRMAVKLMVAMPETGGAVQGENPDRTTLVTMLEPAEYNVAPVYAERCDGRQSDAAKAPPAGGQVTTGA